MPIAEHTALRLAQASLEASATLAACAQAPYHAITADPSQEFLFSVSYPYRLGGTDYVAVCKTTGVVRYAGTFGE